MNFISEMEPGSEEMKRAVFGANYKVDSKGNPIEDGPGSDAYWVSPKAHRDCFEAHIKSIRKYGVNGDGLGCSEDVNREAADAERQRINGLRAKAGLSAW
jgi:hypothetical protein